MVALGILIAFYIAIYVTSPFITIFHELGHAFAYLALTETKEIDVFIGSYGNKKTRLNFKIGKLHFYIKQSFPFFSSRGVCQSDSREPNYFKKIIILLAGPFFSFIIACLLGFIVFNTEVHGAIKLYVFALIVCSLISLIRNLRPSTNITTGVNSDGKQLLFVIKMRKVYADYILGCNEFLNQNYVASSEILRRIIIRFPKEESVLRLLFTSLLVLKRYEEAEIYLTRLGEVSSLDANDCINLGYMHSMSGKRELAIENYQKALQIEPNNQLALNNLGYEYIFNEKYDESEKLLTKAIELAPEFAYSYNNLGYIKLLTNHLEEGKQLIEKSIEMEPENAYGYKHLGVYYLKIHNKIQANICFQKALELDPLVVMENYLQEAEN